MNYSDAIKRIDSLKADAEKLMARVERAHGAKRADNDDSHIYHATNHYNLHDIASSGKLNTHRPNFGTDQHAWPDGKTEKRSYWGNSLSHVAPFHPEEGKPVVIRAKREHVQPKTESGTRDLYTTKPVHVKHLEHNMNGKWEKVGDLAKADNGDALEAMRRKRADANEPYLRTAVKGEGVIHVGHQGEYHEHALGHATGSREIYPKKHTTGYINHKGQFWSAKDHQNKLTKYAHENNLLNNDAKNMFGDNEPLYVTSNSLTRKEFPRKSIKIDSARADASNDRYLRTAIKHEGKIHLGDQGENHRKVRDRIGSNVAIGTREGHKSMGFVNHKGHFMDRYSATDYAKENNLIRPNHAKMYEGDHDAELWSEALYPRKFDK